jgi:membrane protease YdiL (CAAX protease family)
MLLVFLTRKEGVSNLSLFHINRKDWRTDLKYFVGLAVISIPVVLGPGMALNEVLYPGSDHYAQVLFEPISMSLVHVLLVAFPVTIGLAELSTYFGYIMPRLQQKLNSRFLGVALPVIFLSLQHCTLPLVFEWGFVAYRALVFLPFSVLLGVVLHKRPSLLIYFSVFHALLDAMTVMMYLQPTVTP